MEYKIAVKAKANEKAEVEIGVPDIRAAFSPIPDPRSRKRREYSLVAMLSLAVVGIMCQHLSVTAIAEWGKDLSEELKQALGFRKGKTPCQSTLHRLFAKLEPAELATALTNYFDPKKPGQIKAVGEEGVAIDGKCQRGRLKFENQTEAHYPIHALSAFCHQTGQVLGQIAIANQAGESELGAAPVLIAQLDWEGRVLTGDALFCQKNLCKQVVEAGGHYLVRVKANQAELLSELRLLFDLNLIPAGLDFDVREAITVDKGHGRIETRQALASNELAPLTDWPYLRQVLQIKRQWWYKGQPKVAISYLVSSLADFEVDVAGLLQLKRGHWSIENSLHYVKDVTMGEDKALIRVGNGADIMSLFRNAAISAIPRSGFSAIAAQLRANARSPIPAFSLLGISLLRISPISNGFSS